MTATLSPAITGPCVIDGMDEAVYHADPVPVGSLSSGGARTLLQPGGPAKFHYERTHPRTGSTKTFDLGHAVHTRALGAGSDLWVIDAADWRTKAAREERDEAYAAGKVPILVDDARRVHAMVDALLDHNPIAESLIRAEGDVEQSLFWQDQATDVWCRARHDKAVRDTSGRLVIVDLKTCEAADTRAITRSMTSYGYHQQDAWYRDAAIALDLADEPGFVFVFVEKTPPHLVHVVQLHPADVAAGRARNRHALDIYAKCTADGVWPGHPTDDITEIELPAWAREDLP